MCRCGWSSGITDGCGLASLRQAVRLGLIVASPTPGLALPPAIASLFWDCEASSLGWERDRDFGVGRALVSGGWAAGRWVRVQLGDAGLRAWIERHRGRGMSPQRLRFWQLVLDIDPSEVSRWIAARRGDPWGVRAAGS